MSLLRRLVATQGVPLLFLAVSVTCIVAAGLSLSRTCVDVLERFSRNLFLVLSLVIPIVAGLGLNFGIVLGAMAGQIGLMTAQNGAIPGTGGLAVAVITSIPIAMGLGYLTGLLFNRARGREMITGIMLGLFASGVYQFVFLILTGPVIPLHAPDVLLPQGMGVRVTLNLTAVERGIDALWAEPLRFGGQYWGEIPVVTWALAGLLLVGILLFFRTKLGQDLRATGQDPDIAEVAGVNVRRCRIIAVILSMVLAGIGQILWLQNMGTMNTYTQHEQVGFYAIAALLVGGATVVRATVWNALVGTLLFHTMIVVVATAGQRYVQEVLKIKEGAQVGEYLREFVAYAVIGTALALHAWRTRGRSL